MAEQLGLIHVYCGNGKGKTTAALGLSLRCAGNGFKVLIVQFLKNGESAEISLISTLENVLTLACHKSGKFSFRMSEDEKAASRELHADMFEDAKRICTSENIDMLVLDEALYAISVGIFQEKVLLEFLKNKAENLEVVLTGRDPSEDILDIADYVSEVNKIKHPFDKKIPARAGIER